MILGFRDEGVTISVKLSDGGSGLYPQAHIIHEGIVVNTVDLTPVAGVNGVYTGVWGGGALGEYIIDYTIYEDASHTIISGDYEQGGEQLLVIESLNELYDYVEFIHDIEGGRWRRVGTEMIFYKNDNVTEVARFSLKDRDGGLAEEDDDVYERERE